MFRVFAALYDFIIQNRQKLPTVRGKNQKEKQRLFFVRCHFHAIALVKNFKFHQQICADQHVFF